MLISIKLLFNPTHSPFTCYKAYLRLKKIQHKKSAINLRNLLKKLYFFNFHFKEVPKYRIVSFHSFVCLEHESPSGNKCLRSYALAKRTTEEYFTPLDDANGYFIAVQPQKLQSLIYLHRTTKNCTQFNNLWDVLFLFRISLFKLK